MINEEGKILGQPKCPNPKCAKPLDGFTSVDKDACLPSEGDISICFYCCEVCVFDKNHHVRTLLLAEYEALDDETKAMVDKVQQQIIWSLDRP